MDGYEIERSTLCESVCKRRESDVLIETDPGLKKKALKSP